MTKWSEYVKKYAKKHKLSYREANMDEKCKKGYQRKKKRMSPRRMNMGRGGGGRREGGREGRREGGREVHGELYTYQQDSDIRKVEEIQNKLHKKSSYRPTDEELKLLTKYGYLDFTKSPDYSCVLWNMDSEEKIQKWNRIIEFYRKSDKFKLYGNFGSRIKGIPISGVNHAMIDEDRTEPGVLVAIRRGFETDDILSFSATGLWYHHIFGFIPFSRIKLGSIVRLIIPLGLQKTAAGFGWYHNISADKDIDGSTLKRRYNGISNFFESLMGTLKIEFPRAGVITKFATPAKTFENNSMIKKWSNSFPGKMRVGYRNSDIHSEEEDVEKIRSVLGISNYKPENGGVEFNFSEDKLLFYNNDGSLLFEIPKVSTYPSLDKYLIEYEYDMKTFKPTGKKMIDTKICSNYGCLITVWPNS